MQCFSAGIRVDLPQQRLSTSGFGKSNLSSMQNSSAGEPNANTG
jgi:hypothetical protein